MKEQLQGGRYRNQEAVAQDLDEITRVCSAMSSSSSRGSAEHSPIAVSGWIDGLELGKRVGKGQGWDHSGFIPTSLTAIGLDL